MNYFGVISQIIKDETDKLDNGVFDSKGFTSLLDNIYVIFHEIGDVEEITTLRISIVQYLVKALRLEVITKEVYATMANTVTTASARVLKNIEQASNVAKYIESVYAFSLFSTKNDPFDSISLKSLKMLVDYPCRLKEMLQSQLFRKKVLQYISEQYDIAYNIKSQTALTSIMETLQRLAIVGIITSEQVAQLQTEVTDESKDKIIRDLAGVLQVDLTEDEALQTSLFSGGQT